ncbi:hypothetical protein UY3_01060 [Chelonia mydas]|uniref:Uncharacterized protein n=1 Tax=Chelonia mydas TaxID=8469 RepID=M7C0J4_CHEMY|nr:hypothetical protein UY3_01060 [Chelonia mydas]
MGGTDPLPPPKQLTVQHMDVFQCRAVAISLAFNQLMTPADDDSSLKHDCHSKTQARFSPPLIAADFLRVYPHEDEIGIWLSFIGAEQNSQMEEEQV